MRPSGWGRSTHSPPRMRTGTGWTGGRTTHSRFRPGSQPRRSGRSTSTTHPDPFAAADRQPLSQRQQPVYRRTDRGQRRHDHQIWAHRWDTTQRLQTVPGKSWFPILRLYGPLESWFVQTWRPGEIQASSLRTAFPLASWPPAPTPLRVERPGMPARALLRAAARPRERSRPWRRSITYPTLSLAPDRAPDGAAAPRPRDQNAFRRVCGFLA
jgi:hypothetical protein